MPPLIEPVDPRSHTYVAPCDCYDCEQSFYNLEELNWYTGRVSDEEAKKIISQYVHDAAQDREYLAQRLQAFGSTLINRWKKKSRQKRQECLQEAAPDLCTENWVSIRYNIKEWMDEYNPYTKTFCRNGRVRSHLLLNWLSVETLINNPMMLLSLLHVRTNYSPADWATWDDNRLGFSWRVANFDVDFSTKCVIMHGFRYGEMVDWHEEPAHRGDILGFPKARLVLEAQSHLMRTLRNIVDNILKEVDASTPSSSEKWKNMTAAGFSHTNEVECWSPYTNQAFSAPPVFSISNLVSIAQTRLEAEGDHLRFLQANPAYMRRHVKTLMQGEHYKSMRLDKVGILIADEIFYSVRLHLEWEGVKNECENVEQIYNRMRDSIHRGQNLPRAFDRAMGALEVRIVNVVNSQARDICTLMSHRPGFSRYFEGSSNKNSSINLKKAIPGESLRQFFDQDPLAWCVFQMTGRPDGRCAFDHAMLFGFLENHLAKSDAKERARLDEFLYKRLSDLAAAHQILFAVRLHRPQNAVREIGEILASEDRLAWKIVNIDTFHREIVGEFHEATKLGELIVSKFCDAPGPAKKKNEAWIEQSQNIRKALELFWEGMRACFQKLLKTTRLNAREIREHMELVSVNLTPEYAEEVEAEKNRMLEQIECARMPAATNGLNELLSTDTYHTSKPIVVEPKEKVKSRPAEQSLSGAEAIHKTGANLETEIERLPPVSKRAFEVLNLMFPTTAEETQKRIRWDLFVHMMIDMGFSARSSGGSAVVFEKLDISSSNSGGRIVFHRPHPSPNVDSVMLQAMGKRMAKWFGWHSDLFVPEDEAFLDHQPEPFLHDSNSNEKKSRDSNCNTSIHPKTSPVQRIIRSKNGTGTWPTDQQTQSTNRKALTDARTDQCLVLREHGKANRRQRNNDTAEKAGDNDLDNHSRGVGHAEHTKHGDAQDQRHWHEGVEHADAVRYRVGRDSAKDGYGVEDGNHIKPQRAVGEPLVDRVVGDVEYEHRVSNKHDQDCQRRRVPSLGQEIPESVALAGKGHRGLGDRIAKIEDAMKDLLAGKDTQVEDAPGYDNSGLTPSSHRAPLTRAKTLGDYFVSSTLLDSSPTLSDRAENEHTTSHSLWKAFPAERDVNILLPESLRTPRYTFAVNSQPHAKLAIETLGAPYPSPKYPGPNTHLVILCKCTLMYAITLQAPCEEFIGLSESSSVLGCRWVTAAVTWQATQEETQGSVENLVCIILEAIFETNCGNLRKAWVIYRKAMTMAQMMGLHRSPMPPLKRIDPTLDVDPEFMWFRIVYMDRYLSLLLGLPQGTTDSNKGALSVLSHETPLGQFERQLNVIASCILERNERAFTASKMTTTKSIDAALLRVSENMPASFWRPANFLNIMVGSPENLLETIRLAAQVYYYGLLIQLHLPYMMHGTSGDAEHEYSKITCVNASREIITRFIAHRSFQPKSSCSRPVDFYTLLAAMTLLLAHLDARYHPNATNYLAHQRFSDRALLDQALERMDAMRDDNKDIVMEDSGKVIRRLLEIEADAASGSIYTASSAAREEPTTEDSEGNEHGDLRLIIPYLGTIKITRQGPVSLEPVEDNFATRQSQASHTEFFYAVEQQSRSDVHKVTQNSSRLGDILASEQLNRQSQLPEDEQEFRPLYPVGLDAENIALQSHLDIPPITANVNDWAFQGADGAFFDSLLRGCPGADKQGKFQLL